MIDQPRPVRRGWVLPNKGSRARKIAILALRPQGITLEEAINFQLIDAPMPFLTLLKRLEFDCGYDIRHIGPRRITAAGRHTFRIVGKHRWNGEYFRIWNVPNNLPKLRSR